MNIYKDMMNFCVKFTNVYFKFSNFRHSFKYKRLPIYKKMQSMPHEGKGRDLFIILNGPSLKKQDISTLKGKDLMFVNRGFMHPLYKELQPLD